MKWTDELRMETPEQIDVDMELAGLGSRFLALLVDVALKLIVTVVLILVVAILAAMMRLTEFARNPSYTVIALLVAALGTLWMAYGVFFEVRRNGQTPGKSVARIRAIRTRGAAVDFTAAGIRNLLTVVYLIPVFYVIDAILILASPRSQRLGDFAAGTIVIRERAVDLGRDPEDALLAYASSDYVFTPAQLEPLTADDRTVLREFLRRRAGMTGQGRSRLALKLAERFGTKTAYPSGDHLDDGKEAVTFLASLLRDLQEFLKQR
jgi:uncharacterized RDD family membrane protein YckC